jgi:hypothetical protein
MQLPGYLFVVHAALLELQRPLGNAVYSFHYFTLSK